MFDIQQLESIEFELANKCNAKCPQCPRYTKGRLLQGLNKDELSLQDIKQSIDTKIISGLRSVIFKGTTGDPIIAKDFLNIVEYFKQHNPKIKVWIATNGGLHNDAYWQSLAEILNSHDKVVFGIDGLADTHSMYRIGTDYNKVLSNAKAFIAHGGNAHWQFIKFQHNQHQWQDCQELSQQLGFTNFLTLHSDRNFAETSLYPADDQTPRMPTGCVSCMSVNKKELFVYADGSVYPCCYLGGLHAWSAGVETETDYSMLLKMTDPTHKKIPNYNLEHIVESSQFQNFSQVLITPLRLCKKHCS